MKFWRESQIGDEIELAYGKSLPANAREVGAVEVFGSNGCVGSHSTALILGPGIVIGRKGSVGKIAYSYEDFWPIDTTYYVVNKNDHDWRFLYHLLSSVGLDGLNSHSAVPGLNREIAYSVPISLPAKTEQKKIASVLDTVERAVQQEGLATEQAQALKRAAMHTLFTHGLRGEAQKETEIGPVPEGWAYNELGNLAEIAYGAQAAVANATDPAIGTLILTNINLDIEGHINLEKRRYYKIPDGQYERLILRKGDVLFNWRSGSANHIGKTVMFDLVGEYTYSSFILRFRPHRLVSNQYLFRWLTHLRVSGFFTSQRNVSSINSVYNASLSATIPIWFPDNEQQTEIVAILDAIDRKIDLHRRKRTVLEELFKTLLHKLMTGEIQMEELDLTGEQSDPGESINVKR